MTEVYARASGEILAATITAGNQSEPKSIALEGGGYVLVWTDLQGTTNQECRGQVFDNNGNKVGAEFLVNTDTTGNEFQPKVAALEGGGFVVSFTDSNGDGAGNTGIRLQMFDATGGKVGGEFSANTTAAGNQTLSSVAELPGGGFVALWMDANNSGDVVGRIFDSAGTGGAEFTVNTNVINSQRDAVATALSNGNFIVTWTDSATSDVRAQIMTTAGTKVGGEFAVATATTGNQGVPSITALKDGGFVVTWEDYSGVGGDTSQSAIKGQVFNDNGVKVGSEFLVNTTTYYFQQTPSVSALDSGGFVVAWLDRSGIGGDTQDSGSNAIKAQVFNADGSKDGIEFLVNTTIAQNQWLPTVAGLGNGGFAISWVDASGTIDTTGYGVITQVFAPSDGTISDIALTNGTVAETQAENTIVGTLSANGPVTVARDLTYTIVSDTTGGAFGIKDDKLIVADNGRLDFETATSASVTILVSDGAGHSYQETFTLAVTDVATEVRWHAGNDIAVNTTTTADQSLQAMAALTGGGYVVTWTDASATGGDTSSGAIRGQRFDADGHKVGGEFLVNTTTAGSQTASSVVGTADGGFFVVWQDGGVTPSAIRGQFYDADGAKVGAELRIDDAAGAASVPEVTLLNSGNFLIVWADGAGDAGTGTAGGIRGQLVDATGTKVGSEFTLNTQITNVQADPAIAATATGFVATWTDNNSAGVIRAQFFDDAGTKVGSEFQVNVNTAMNQLKPTATVLANGDVLFTWWDLSNVGGDASNGGIKGRLYNSSGTALTGEFLMNTTVNLDQDAPRVAALADGGFVLVFEDRSEYLLGNIRAQQFDAAGNKVGGEWIANYDVSYAQKVPTIVQLENGDLAIAWYSGKNNGDPLGWDVMTRVFSTAVAGTDPVANADSLSAATDVATTFAAIDLLGNDTHAFGTLAITGVTSGTGGTAVLNPDGSVTFTSSAGFEGDATFTYTVSDGEGGTSSATVTVDVAIPNLTPVHSDFPAAIYTVEDGPVGLNGGIAIDPPPSWISDADSATITTTLTTTSGSFSITVPGAADVTGNGTGTVTITGTIADVNAAVYYASYVPAPDVYGTREITVTTSDGHSSVSNTIDVSIAPLHDAPEGTEVTHTAVEDTPYTLHALDFGFSDVDGDSLAHVVLTSTPVHGRIVDLGGYVVEEDIDGDGDPDLFLAAPQRDLVAGDVLDLSLMALGYIVYIPEANANGIAADSFTYQVVDNGGVPGSAGTVDLSPNTLTFDITGVNDVPNLTGLDATVAIPENTMSAIDDDVTFTDPEGNFDGGTLVVSGALADDFVGFGDIGTGPGQIGGSGGLAAEVTYEGVVIGQWSGGGLGETFTVTFNSAATSEAIEALIEDLGFGNTSDTPPASRDITITVTDNSGDATSRTVTIETTAVNDAPTATVPADEALSGYVYQPIALTGIQVGDVDAGTAQIVVNVIADVGTIQFDAVAAAGFGVAGSISGQQVSLNGTIDAINAFLATVGSVSVVPAMSGYVNVQVVVDDQGASGVDPGLTGDASSETYSTSFVVEVLNHAPTVVAHGLAATEQVPVDLKGTIDVADSDSPDLLTVTLSVDFGTLEVLAGASGVTVADSGTAAVTVTGTAAQIQALLELGGDPTSTVSYIANGDAPPASAYLTVTVDDGTDQASSTGAIAITAVNDAPVLDLDVFESGNDAAAGFAIGDLPVTLAPYAEFTDADNDDFDGATLTVSVTANGDTGDQLRINDIGTGLGEISVSGNTISYEGTVIGTFTGGDDGNPLVVTFNEDACHCGVQAVIGNVNFEATGTDPGVETRTIQFALTDGAGTAHGGSDTAVAEVTVDITAPPSVSIGATGTAVEQVQLDLKGTIHVADLDTTGTVTVTLSVTEGVLTVDPGTSGVTVDQDPFVPSEVTLTGTVDQIEDLLNTNATSTITYEADSDFPSPTDDLTVTIDDGLTTSTDTATIAITAVNDAPEIELDYFEAPVANWTEGDGPVTLARGAVFDDDNEDFDGAVLTISLGGATSGDQLTIETGSGLEISGSDVIYDDPVDGPTVVGTWSGGDDGNPLTITFNADACHCAVELAMASIQYENTDDLTAASTRTVEVTLVDGGGTALGGIDTSTETFDLAVLPFASVIAGPDAVVDEDTGILLTGVVIDGLAADPASDILVVRLHVEHGTLAIRDDVSGGLAASGITGIGTDTLVLTGTQDAINATLATAGGLTYQGDAEFSGADALAIDAHLDAPVEPFAFTSTGGLPIGLPVIAVDALDLDGDGTDELVIGINGGLVLLGSFGSGVLTLPDGGTPLDFAFADIDGDGMTDIAFVAGNGTGKYLAFYSSDIGALVPVAEVGDANDLALGDFNGDGLIDFAVPDMAGAGVTVVLQDSSGGAPVPSEIVTGHLAYSIVAGDFNGDGKLDLLVGNAGELPGPTGPGSVDLLLGNGDGTFAPAVGVAAPGTFVGEVIAADFNGDGALDFAFAYVTSLVGGGGGVQVALGNGDGTFAAPVVYETTTSGIPVRLLAADLNGDGQLDLAVANQDLPGTVSVLGGNGDGTFAAPVAVGTYDQPIEIATGDPDSDGDLDLIVSALEGGGVLDFLVNESGAVFHEITGSKTITVNPVDDDAVAVDDSSVSVNEDSVVAIDVLANDSDVDGPAPAIATVEGQTLTAGQSVTLASGAIVTLEADGRLSYDPNGQFHPLISPALALATGASNDSATDSFSYTLAGGASATVTVTVIGVDGPGDELWGTPLPNVITGTGGDDVIRAFRSDDVLLGGDGSDLIYGNGNGDTLAGGNGNDELHGGNGDDLLEGGDGDDVLVGNLGDDTMRGGTGDDTYYVGQLGDLVVENPGEGSDTVRTQIDYTLTDNVETLVLSAGARSGTGNGTGNTLFGSGGADTLSGLAGDDVLRGRDGRDVLLGGDGEDLLDGGVGKDTLTGGADRDVFQFRDGQMGATRGLADMITDFSQADHEKIQLNLVDADVNTAGNQAFAFLGTGAFTGTAGELRYEVAGGNTWVAADTNGDGTADWHIGLTGVHVLVAGDFVL